MRRARGDVRRIKRRAPEIANRFPLTELPCLAVSGGGSLSRAGTFIPREIAVYYQLIARRIRDWAPRRA